MATHASILTWEVPWTEEPGGLQYMGLNELDTTERLSVRVHTHTHTQGRVPPYILHLPNGFMMLYV